MKPSTLTPAGLGVEFLVEWATKPSTLAPAGTGVEFLVEWAMPDYSTSSFTPASTRVEVITRSTRTRPADFDLCKL